MIMFQNHYGDLSEDAFESLLSQHTIACDTETTGLNWLTDRLALVQFHAPKTGTHIVKVDMAQSGNLVRSLIEAPSVRKVFHHAPFDLAFLKATWKTEATNVACTKIAAKLLYASQSINSSLQSLLKERLGVHISKGRVRTSDWEVRELSEEQIRYAHQDVAFLLPLLSNLETALASVGRLDLYRRCCDYLPVRADTDQLALGDIFSY